MKKEVKQNLKWKGRQKSKSYTDIVFEELIVKNAKLKDIAFINVHFKNSYLGFKTKYTECKFINCKFFGRYSCLGGFATYTNCLFEQCKFQGIELFKGQHFSNCTFTGSMKNHILYDNVSKSIRMDTVFKNCDLSGVIFDNVNIYGKNIFQNTILPKEGLKLLNNMNDELIQRAEEICMGIDSIEKTESIVIFQRTNKEGQNPIILDKIFLETFFKTEESRNIFENIVKGYELN